MVHRNALLKGTRLNEYIIEKVLGKPGGFGVAYLARDTNLDQWVAIKEYLPNDLAMREGATVHPKSTHDEGDFEWGLERFRDEAKTLARFVHPNVVQVLRYFEANGTGYMVMRYEDGLPLNEILEKETLTEDELVQNILLPLLDGLKQVHAASFLHRDIKPGNIYMRRSDETPVLLDFGAARNALGSKSKSLTSIVTAGYAPFEQYYSDGNQGPWSDIYALGAVAYRIVTGERPPEAPSRIRKDKMIPAVEAAQGKYSQSLLQAIDHALAMDEEDRPQNCEEWKRELTAQTAAEPSPAKLSPESELQAKNWFTKLIRGHYGLSKTYWRFGGAIFGLFIIGGGLHRNNKLLGEFLLTALMGMAIIVTVGVWKASGKYTGKKFWVGLAKITSVVFLLLLGLFNYTILGTTSENDSGSSPLGVQENTVKKALTKSGQVNRHVRKPVSTEQQNSVLPIGPAAWNKYNLLYAKGNIVYIVDVKKGKLINLQGHQDTVRLISSTPDGKLLISADDGGQIKLWDLENKHFIRNMAKLSEGVATFALSPSGTKLIISENHKRSFKLVDLQSGNLLEFYKEPKGDWFSINSEHTIEFNPDETKILSGIQGDFATSLKMWDTGGNLIKYFKFRGLSEWEKNACAGIDEDGIVIHSISINQNGTRALVTAGYGGGEACVDDAHQNVFENIIHVFDMGSGMEVKGLEGHASEVRVASFSPDGSKAVSVSVDGVVNLWDVENRRLERSIVNDKESGAVIFVKFVLRGEGVLLYYGGKIPSVYLYDLSSNEFGKLP